MKNFDPSSSIAHRVVFAIKYCKKNRSAINDIFYLNSLRHIDMAYLEANIVPIEIAERVKESWYECFKTLSSEAYSLNENARKHLEFWQEFFMLPSTQFH